MVQTVLVTGGTGFTGGHLCLKLAKLGHRVRTVARAPEKAGALAKAGVEVVRGDLKDRDSLVSAARDCEIVYHIAALYRQEGVPDSEFRAVNVEGTVNVLEAALARGARRFVHCSTVGVHGHVSRIPSDESAPFNPGDIYQETKVEGEKRAREFFRTRGLPGVVFRPTGIYGPGDMRFLKLFRHINSGRFRMIGSGGVFYHLTYVDDLTDGIILCGTRPGAVGGVYILGGERYVTLRELTDTIAEALGVTVSRVRIPFAPVYAAAFLCEKVCRPLGIEPPIFRRRVDFFRKDRAFDISKARRELGYAPRVDVREGIRRTAGWYREQGLL
jgi:nucleoside-diphosphate-sugar epimerase